MPEKDSRGREMGNMQVNQRRNSSVCNYRAADLHQILHILIGMFSHGKGMFIAKKRKWNLRRSSLLLLRRKQKRPSQYNFDLFKFTKF